MDGLAAQERLEECKLTANRNTVPFDERPPMVASGVRLGTPAATMRGFDEDDFARGRLDHRRRARRTTPTSPALRGRAEALCEQRPLYPGFRGLHDVRRVSVTEVTHPLVQHKLSYLRDKDTPTVHFRKLVEEVTLLLTYEATKDLPTEDVEIETPLERMPAPRISGKKVAVCPILRAGLGMLDGVLTLISGARVGFIGLYRDEETLAAGRVLREAAARRRRPGRDPARPDARDRQLDRARGPARQGRRRDERAPDLDHRGAGRDREHRVARTPTSRSSSRRSTAA